MNDVQTFADQLETLRREKYPDRDSIPIEELRQVTGVTDEQLKQWRREKKIRAIDDGNGNITAVELNYDAITPNPRTPKPDRVPSVQDFAAKLEELRASKHAQYDGVPIHEMRDWVRQQFGADAAHPEVFDQMLKQWRRDGLVRLVSIGDRSRATPEQLAASIPGDNETFFRVEPGPKLQSQQPAAPAPQAAQAAPVDPAKAWDAASAAMGGLMEKTKRLGGIIRIPELVDEMQKAIPGLTTEQAHQMLQQWQKEDKITLQLLATDPKLEPRAGEGIDSPRGKRFYVKLRPDAQKAAAQASTPTSPPAAPTPPQNSPQNTIDSNPASATMGAGTNPSPTGAKPMLLTKKQIEQKHVDAIPEHLRTVKELHNKQQGLPHRAAELTPERIKALEAKGLAKNGRLVGNFFNSLKEYQMAEVQARKAAHQEMRGYLAVVEAAAKAGEPIPPEVLEEYPIIAEKYGLAMPAPTPAPALTAEPAKPPVRGLAGKDTYSFRKELAAAGLEYDSVRKAWVGDDAAIAKFRQQYPKAKVFEI